MTSEAILRPWGAVWGAPDSDASAPSADPTMDRDRALVELCLNGSDGAWDELVRAHARLIYGVCYRFTGRPEDARDLTQEVFLRVFRSLHTFDPASGAFRTWLVRLARNLLIDHYRKTKKEQLLDPLDDALPVLEEKGGLGGSAERLLAGREAGELLQAALRQLSPELREAVILRDLHEMKYKEIAAALRVPEGTVKSRINRGRREIARHLRALGIRP